MKEWSHKKIQKIRKFQNGPPYLSAKKYSGGQQEEEHGVVHQLQQEHHQSYLMHHYQNANHLTQHTHPPIPKTIPWA